MSVCSRKLQGSQKVTYSALVNSIGEVKTDAIYNLYEGFNKDIGEDFYKDSDTMPAYEFFKTVPNNTSSELFNEIADSGEVIVDTFEIIFSDDFRKQFNWLEAQKRLFKGEKFNDIAEKMKLNPKDFHKKTFEPKLNIILNYKNTELSTVRYNGNEMFSVKLNVSEELDNNHKKLIAHYATVFKKKYGVNIEYVSEANLPKEKKGMKGWFNKKENAIYLVKENMTLDTPIHEMFHPILEIFKRDNHEAYITLIRELNKFKDEAWYKQVETQYSHLSKDKLYDELIVHAVAFEASNMLKGKIEHNKIEYKGFKNKLQGLLKMIKEFFGDFNNYVKDKYNIEGNILKVSDIKNTSFGDMASIMLSDVEIAGVSEKLLEKAIFYDLDGNPIIIDNINDLDSFIEMHSKTIENNNKSEETSGDNDLKNFYDKSFNYKSIKIAKIDFNGGITKFIRESENENSRYNILKDVARKFIIHNRYSQYKKDSTQGEIDTANFKKYAQTKDYHDELQRNMSIITEAIGKDDNGESMSDEYKALLKLYNDVDLDNNASANIGTGIHKVQEFFFEVVNSAKGVDNRETLTDDIYEDIKKATLDKLGYMPTDRKYILAETQINELIKFTKEIELSAKDRKIVYKPEFHVSNDIIGKQGVIDLFIIYDDAEYDIYDAKSHKQEFQSAWKNSFANYDRDGLTNISVSGEHATALQVSLYSLIVQAEVSGLKPRKLGAIYYDIDIDTDYDEDTGIKSAPYLSSIKLHKDSKGVMHSLPLTNYRKNIVVSLGDKVRDLFVDKSKYEKDGLNTITDTIAYLADGNTLDSYDVEKQAKRKLNNLDVNPDNPSEKGIKDRTQREMLSLENLGKKPKDYVFISLENMTEEEQIIELEKYYRRVNGQHDEFIDKVIEWQNTGNSIRMSNKQSLSVRKILDTLTPDDRLERASNILGMEDFEDVPLLVAYNHVTGVSRLIYMSKEVSGPINIKGDDGKTRTTILGMEYQDKYAKTKFKDKKLREANTNNFRKMITGLAAQRLKQLDSSFVIDRMFITQGQMTGTFPTPIDMYTIMPMLSVVKDTLQKNTAGYMQEIFSDNSLFDPRIYKPDYIQIFKFNIASSSNVKNSGKVIDLLTSFQEQKANMGDVLDELLLLEKEMRLSIGSEDSDYMKNQEYLSLMHLIQDLFKITDKIANGKVNSFHSFLSIEHNVPEHTRQALINTMKMFDAEIKRRFNIYESEKNDVLKSMMESKHVSFNNKLINWSMLKTYDNLFQNKNDYDNPNTLMTLKDPDDMSDSSLNDEEREFIRFFNDVIYKSLLESNPGLFKKAGAETEEDQRNLVKGWVPIYKATPQSRQVKGKFKAKINQHDDREQVDRDSDKQFEMDNNLGDMYSNHSYAAGLDRDTGKMREGFDFDVDVETNLEYVMNRFMVKAVETTLHNYTLLAARSLETVLQGQYFMFGNEKALKDVTDALETSVDHYIRHETKGKEGFHKYLDKASFAATTLAITFSAKQAVMDSMTYTLSSSAYLIANQIFKVFGGDAKSLGYFSAKSWAKAGKMILSNDKLARLIASDFGLDTTDTMLMGGDSRLETMRKTYMEYGFIITKGMSIAVLSQLVLAAMIEDGSINGYFVSEEGSLEYDETKDLRFYTEEGKIKDEAFLYAVKKNVYEEGGFNIEAFDPDNPKELIDRKLKVGYTFGEINTIKAKAVQMIGSMDKDARSRAEKNVIFKHALKFRAWLIAKKDLYTMDRHMSDTYMEWTKILQPDGTFKYELDPQEVEGIIYSLLSVTNKLRVYQLKALRDGTITDVEKKNMAILASHLFFFASVWLLAASIDLTCDDDPKADCWVKDSQIGKSTKSMLSNVQSDMLVAKTLWDIMFNTNSIFPGISLLIGTTGRLIDYTISIPGSDNVLADTNDLMKKSWATYRTGVEFSDIFTYNGSDKPIKNAGFDWDKDEFTMSFPAVGPISDTYLDNVKENFPELK